MTQPNIDTAVATFDDEESPTDKIDFSGEIFLTRDELCERFKISKKTLSNWHSANAAPPTVTIAGCRRYPQRLLEQFLAGHVQGIKSA